MSFSHDKLLDQIALRVASGERLSFEDGLVLYATDDLPAIGKLADSERRRPPWEHHILSTSTVT